MTYEEWAESFKIFAQYEPKGNAVAAEHDELWAGPDWGRMNVADRQRLEEIGWTPSDEGGWHIFT